MIQFIRMLRDADSKTRWFYFQWIIYMIAIILTTVYAYARLEFDRSGKPKTEQTP
ncbi:MAG: hypothetical protein Tsb0021_01110 [Chlamydiales bacterium]